VPFAPGGGTDQVGRLIALRMTEGLGQQVVVENRPGAGTTIAAALVAKSAPDGYTLVVSSNSSHAMAPHLYANAGYDPVRDFTAVSLVATTPHVLTVGTGQPFRTVQEFIAAAKAKPGTISNATGGVGSNTHLAGALFEEVTGTQIVHVPYKGSSPAVADLMGGVIASFFDTAASATQPIRAGKVRGLAVSGERRLADLPDVPTFAEAGVKGYEATAWYGIHAPAGTPRAIIDRLNAEIVRGLANPEARESFRRISADPAGNTPEQYEAFVKSESERWGRLIRKLQLKVE
jgi:tripartite-type tricarboxylate transporter receptor subunit TctC